jgi:hypothetical protein
MQLGPVVLTFEHGSVNNPPVAVDDMYTADPDMVLAVPAPGVLINDTDVDGDTLTAVLNAGPSNGTLDLSADGSFVYISTGFVGIDSFTYRANGGSADSNVATITINVYGPPPCVDVTGVTLSVVPGTLNDTVSFNADIAPDE